jgi:hypothetical protein
VPWLRLFVAGIPSQRAGFAPRSVHVGFLSVKVALGLVYLSVLRSSPCQYDSIVTLHAHISPGGQAIGQLVTAVQRHRLTLYMNNSPSIHTFLIPEAGIGYIIQFDAVLREIKSEVNQSYNTHGKYKNRIGLQMLYRE